MGEGQEALKEEERVKAVNFAKLYLVFEKDAGKAILDHWDKTLRRKRIAVNASIQEYAAHCALRDLVEGIHQQIEFAHTEGRNPQ